MANMDLAAGAAPKQLHWLKDRPVVKPGSPEHEQLLAVGYRLSAAEAKEIIKRRKEDPASYSLEEVRRAEALLEALAAKPKITATRDMWKRPLTAD